MSRTYRICPACRDTATTVSLTTFGVLCRECYLDTKAERQVVDEAQDHPQTLVWFAPEVRS